MQKPLSFITGLTDLIQQDHILNGASFFGNRTALTHRRMTNSAVSAILSNNILGATAIADHISIIIDCERILWTPSANWH